MMAPNAVAYGKGLDSDPAAPYVSRLPPPPALGIGGAGIVGGSSAPPPMVSPRGFGPTDGGQRPGMGMPKTGGVNVGVRPVMPPKAMTAGAQVMPGGRAFKKGGMVGCDWSPKSSATMRGAARKGK